MFDWIALVCVDDVEFIPKSIVSTAQTIQINNINACDHDCSVLFITFGLSIVLFKSSIEHTSDYEFIQTVLLLNQMDSINYSIQ